MDVKNLTKTEKPDKNILCLNLLSLKRILVLKKYAKTKQL
jgi:hypothetical protein